MKSKMLVFRESRWITRASPFLILMALAAVFTAATKGQFIEPKNLLLVLEQALITATVASGAIFIFGTGNVNIAMGAATALTATITTYAYLATNSLFVMIIVALIVGTILMTLMSLISSVLKVNVMFVTIVMMVLLMAIQNSIIGSGTLSLPFALTSGLKKAYFPYIAFFAYFAFCVVLFHFTSLGRAIRLIGTNRTCAEQSGLEFGKYLMLAFIISGIGVGLGALMTMVRTGNISTNTASSLNMDCMLAIVLGGMSVFGGSKSYIYAGILGALTVTFLNNGFLMVGVDATMIQMIRGIIFLVLVSAGQKRPKGLPAPEG